MGMRNLSFLAAVSVLAFSAPASSATVSTDPHPIVISARHAASLDQAQMVIGYGDLKLAGAQGQRTLMRRVSTAIDSLCIGGTVSLTDPVLSLKCQRDAWNDVRPQLAEVMPTR